MVVLRASKRNHLQLNVKHDLRRTKAPVTTVNIQSVSVYMREEYKYLDNKLDWSKNVDTVNTKGQSCVYFLKQLRSFNICRTMLQMFYECVVASAIMHA